MQITRRHLLGAMSLGATAAPLAGAFSVAARAQSDSDNALYTDRFIGSPTAKVVVNEYFSLTCTHCAAFARETLPQVKSDLVNTGKVRLVFRDFPLDQVALNAAMVARALPLAQYDPFIEALFASQDRWAFARGINYTDELYKMAALAGMSRATFDATLANDKLKTFILTGQDEAEHKYDVNSTPTFVVNGKPHPGEMDFAEFSKMVQAAGG